MYKYCDVASYLKVAGKMYCIVVDSGQLVKGALSGQYKDKGGNAYVFYSPMDGVNFMAAKNWEISAVYNEGSVAHFIMRKRCN